MVDNADSAGLHLKRYIPTGGPGTVLITTTDEQLAMCGHNFCKISSMDDDEAFNLLLQYKRPGADFDCKETEAARILATQVLGGLPLAIAQAGSYIFNNHYTYTDYTEEFRKSPQVSLGAALQAEQLASGHQPIWTTFALSIRRIKELSDDGSADAVDLLKTLCFLHNEAIHHLIFSEALRNMHNFPSMSEHLPPLIKSTHRWDAPNIRAAFNILCRYSLLNPTSSAKGQYSMHSIVQTTCRNLMSSEEQNQHSFHAASLMATALAGIKTPLSWIENPSGFNLQKFMLPHIKTCVTDRNLSLFQFRNGLSLELVFSMLLLFAKANAATGHLQDARSLVERGLRVLDIYSSSERPIWIHLRLWEQLATCEAHLGQHTEALSLRRKVFEALDSTEGAYSNTRCVAMMNFSDSLWAVGKREHALKIAKGCLRIRELSLEPGDPKIHRTKRKVAEFLHGLEHRRRALVLREEVYSEAESKSICTDIEKLDFVASKAALSDSYQWDGQLLKALELRHEVYEIRNDILGPEHPETLLAHDKLLVTKRYFTRNAEEQQRLCQLWKRSVVIWTRTVGALHPHTLEARVNLGLQHSIIHDVTAALNEQEDVLNIRRRQFEEHNHLENLSTYLSSMANVSSLLVKIKQPQRAFNLRKQALSLAIEHCDLDDASIARAYNGLLNCDVDIRRRHLKDILKERRGLLKAQKSIFPEGSPILLKTSSCMATDFERLGRRRKAVGVRRRLLGAQQTCLGPENRETVDNMKKLALILARQSRRNHSFHPEAVSLLQKVEGIQNRLLGPDHLHTLATRAELQRVRSRPVSWGNEFTLLEKTLGSGNIAEGTTSSDSSGSTSSSMAETDNENSRSGDNSSIQSSDSHHQPDHRDAKSIHYPSTSLLSGEYKTREEMSEYSRWLYVSF